MASNQQGCAPPRPTDVVIGMPAGLVSGYNRQVTDALYTFGHGTAGAEEIVALLRDAEIANVVDVRSAPGSRHNPHVARTRMAEWLDEANIAYQWAKRLGGWRRNPSDSPDRALRNASFRGYAAHMRTPEFREAIDELLAATTRTSVLCSESVWWRCHRSMIADYVVRVRAVPVWHLMHDGRLQPHRPSRIARVSSEGDLVYDGGQAELGT